MHNQKILITQQSGVLRAGHPFQEVTHGLLSTAWQGY